jgi:hypothetical protein
LVAARGIASEPRLDLFEKSGAAFRVAFTSERGQGVSDHRQRPLPVESGIGREHAWVRQRAGFCLMERNTLHSAATFKAPLRLPMVREKVSYCAEQVRAESPAFLLGVGDSSARQQVGKKIVRKFARGGCNSQLAAKEHRDRFIVGIA